MVLLILSSNLSFKINNWLMSKYLLRDEKINHGIDRMCWKFSNAKMSVVTLYCDHWGSVSKSEDVFLH